MADDIIDIEDYEVKDTQIVETSQDDSDYNDFDSGNGSFNGYDDQNTKVYGFSGSLSDPKILILIMVVVLLIAIFIMTFD